MIFANYAMRRESLIQAIYEDRITGWWDQTLFPILKDMIAYGADSLKGDTLDEWVDAALDATMATLTTAAPMLAPGVLAARELVEKPLKHGAESVRKAAHDWAIGQPAVLNRLSYSRRGLTDFDASEYTTKSAATSDDHFEH
jgi:hypothetical protein